MMWDIFPSSSSSLYIWNQGSSYLIYWQLGAWFQVYRKLEDEGLLNFKCLLNNINRCRFAGFFFPSTIWAREFQELTVYFLLFLTLAVVTIFITDDQSDGGWNKQREPSSAEQVRISNTLKPRGFFCPKEVAELSGNPRKLQGNLVW